MAVQEYVNKLGQKGYQPVLEDGLALYKRASGRKIWTYHGNYYKPALYPKFWAEFLADLQQRREKRDDWKTQRGDWAKSE